MWRGNRPTVLAVDAPLSCTSWNNPLSRNFKLHSQSPDVSICLAVRPDRVHFVTQTLLKNLKSLARDKNFEYLVLLPQSAWNEKLMTKWEGALQNESLKIYGYTHLPDSELRNATAYLASGKVVYFIEEDDVLSPRMASYVWKELTSGVVESLMTIGPRGKWSQQLAISRDTFFEFGGFDSQVIWYKQVDCFAYGVNMAGVSRSFRPHDILNKSIEPKPHKWPLLFRSQPSRWAFPPFPQDKIQRIR